MGSAMSCPAGHAEIISIDFAVFTPNWRCDTCRKSFSTNDGRWRCCSKCDYDVCTPCMKKVEYKPNHPHPCAPLDYKCHECGEDSKGDRIRCSTCKPAYEACYVCILRKITRRDASPTDGGGNLTSLTIEPTPFASGATRDAFKAMVTADDGQKKQYVLKAFKPKYFNAGMDMDIVVKIHLKAYELAGQFNKEMQLNHPIIFKRPFLHTMKTTTERDGKPVFVKGEKVALEPFIYGKYVKFNSNSGYALDGFTAPGVFTHYTWHKTRELIVCDLQGVRQVTGDKHDGYYFTDPAINSLKQEWGPTDIGKPGILNFFKSHQCSKFCEKWAKPTLADLLAVREVPVVQHTTFAGPTGGAEALKGMDTDLAQMFARLLSGLVPPDAPK